MTVAGRPSCCRRSDRRGEATVPKPAYANRWIADRAPCAARPARSAHCKVRTCALDVTAPPQSNDRWPSQLSRRLSNTGCTQVEIGATTRSSRGMRARRADAPLRQAWRAPDPQRRDGGRYAHWHVSGCLTRPRRASSLTRRWRGGSAERARVALHRGRRPAGTTALAPGGPLSAARFAETVARGGYVGYLRGCASSRGAASPCLAMARRSMPHRLTTPSAGDAATTLRGDLERPVKKVTSRARGGDVRDRNPAPARSPDTARKTVPDPELLPGSEAGRTFPSGLPTSPRISHASRRDRTH